MRFLILLVAALTISGCSQQPTLEQVRSADYGIVPSQEECSALVEAKIGVVMKDPSSLQWKHSTCRASYWGSVPIMGLPIIYGYMQTGSVNGKNSYGAYTGFRPYQAMIRNGRVIRYCLIDDNGLCSPSS